MKHIHLYEDLSSWTKETFGLTTIIRGLVMNYKYTQGIKQSLEELFNSKGLVWSAVKIIGSEIGYEIDGSFTPDDFVENIIPKEPYESKIEHEDLSRTRFCLFVGEDKSQFWCFWAPKFGIYLDETNY